MLDSESDSNKQIPHSTKATPPGTRTTPRDTRTAPVVGASKVDTPPQQTTSTQPLPTGIGRLERTEAVPSRFNITTLPNVRHALAQSNIYSATATSGFQQGGQPAPLDLLRRYSTSRSPSIVDEGAPQTQEADPVRYKVSQDSPSPPSTPRQDERRSNRQLPSTGPNMSLSRSSLPPQDKPSEPERGHNISPSIGEVASPASEDLPGNEASSATTRLPLRSTPRKTPRGINLKPAFVTMQPLSIADTSAHASDRQANSAIRSKPIARKSAPSDPRYRATRPESRGSSTHSTRPRCRPPSARPPPEEGSQSPVVPQAEANQESENAASASAEASRGGREQLTFIGLPKEQHAETLVIGASVTTIPGPTPSRIEDSILHGQDSLPAPAAPSNRYRENLGVSNESNEAIPATRDDLVTAYRPVADGFMTATEHRGCQELDVTLSNTTLPAVSGGFRDTPSEVESSLKKYLQERYEDHAYLVKVSRDLL